MYEQKTCVKPAKMDQLKIHAGVRVCRVWLYVAKIGLLCSM